MPGLCQLCTTCPVELSLVREVIRLKKLSIKVVWTRGHVNEANNIVADFLARTAADLHKCAELKGLFSKG
jgi:ribonuclease HI